MAKKRGRRGSVLKVSDPLTGEIFVVGERQPQISNEMSVEEARKEEKKSKREKYENQLADQLANLGVPAHVREFQFHPERKWRFDFAWPEMKIAAECEGGIFAGGRHTTGAGFREDTHKYNAAAELGWRVFKYEDSAIRSGDAAAQLSRVIRGYSAPKVQPELLAPRP